MSLEAHIQELTAAVKALVTAIASIDVGGDAVGDAVEPTAPKRGRKKDAPEVAAPAASPSVPALPPGFQPFTPPAPPAAPAMPVPPTFVAPPAPQQAGIPFSDGASLLKWVMEKYKALGPVKGASIQKVINDLGYSNVNDIKPAHYADFHAKVEALA